MRVLAHRGFSHQAPENTRAAFEAALAAGADGVELDVTCSADDVPVVIHDDTLERTTDGHGPVTRQPLEALQRLDAGGWFDPRFAGERIPTLAEALDGLAGQAEVVNVELKGGRGAPRSLVARSLAVLVEHAIPARTIVSSFDPRILRRVRAMDPRWPVALLFGQGGWVSASWRLWATWIGVDWWHPRLALVDDVLATGRPAECLNVWTVNDPGEVARLAALGVGGVITDRPEVARRALD